MQVVVGPVRELADTTDILKRNKDKKIKKIKCKSE